MQLIIFLKLLLFISALMEQTVEKLVQLIILTIQTVWDGLALMGLYCNNKSKLL